jgi:hypothetical protein
MNHAKPVRTGRTYLSWALFALSAALFIAVALLWYQGRGDDNQPAPVPKTPGQNEAINVKQALEAQGLKVTFAQGGGRSNELSVAGQLFDVDGGQLYVFIYPQGPDQREGDTTEIDPADMTIVNTRGTPVAGGPPKVSIGSNVVAVLYGGSDETATKVQRAIEGLP